MSPLGPLMPTGLRIVQSYFTPENITVTFEWDPPQGSGPEVVVDYYRIAISPAPLSHPSINSVNSSAWNVTLDYNTPYTANITAVNCAGESSSYSLENIEYGMCILTPTPPPPIPNPHNPQSKNSNLGCTIHLRYVGCVRFQPIFLSMTGVKVFS